eukprot:Seg5659.1 transcript_id=Seg5659.1/GoldUCD/mRNA.D3Y31 product="hypothetical protein" pseudo=true protein_id=Seg5659.1/GoldUCD/D3Y31
MQTTAESEKNIDIRDAGDEVTEKELSIETDVNEETEKTRPVDHRELSARRSTRVRKLPSHLRDFKLH